MPFLIGLGIIVAIVYANSLYDYLKEKKAKAAETGSASVETGSASETAGSPVHETAGSVAEEAVGAAGEGTQPASGETAVALWLADRIAEDLQNGRHIFGLPLRLCERDDSGLLVAMDKEENLYVIETALRAPYDDFYDQVKADREQQRRRIQKDDGSRKVYGIVCTTEPSVLLMAAAEKDAALRIYGYRLVFENIV